MASSIILNIAAGGGTVEEKTQLFVNGQVGANTGGFVDHHHSGTTITAPIQLKNGTNRLYLNEYWERSAIATVNMIDLTNVKIIKVDFIVRAYNQGLPNPVQRPIKLGVRKIGGQASWVDNYEGNDAETVYTTNIDGDQEASGTLTLNVNHLSGAYYVGYQTRDITSGNNFHRLWSWLDNWVTE